MRKHAPIAWLLMPLAALALLGGCVDADTLGDEPPTEVQVGSPPRWDNGIGTLMTLKCANCHQVPAGPLAPAGLPDLFDARYHMTAPSGYPGAVSTLSAINSGILRMALGPGTRKMPLDYATPLTASELAALEAWALALGP